jgi:hypothetical protein
MLREKYIAQVLCLVVFATATARAESVFIISQHDSTTVQAYSIDGDHVHYQGQGGISTWGGVGIDVWPEKELMFLTFEGSPKIVWASTKTLEEVGEFNTGVNNLAGIVVDGGLIYVVQRETRNLYVYSFDEAGNTLNFEAHHELLLPNPQFEIDACGSGTRDHLLGEM